MKAIKVLYKIQEGNYFKKVDIFIAYISVGISFTRDTDILLGVVYINNL